MGLRLVETIYDKNAADIPAMLRQAADNIEAYDGDDPTRCMMAVQVTHDGEIAVYGWGGTDRLLAIGALQAAAVKLADGVEEFSP